MQRSDFRHVLLLPIRWGDMDALGHVNNVEYLRYLESGRIAYMETIQPAELPVTRHIVLADIQCRFRQQLNYPAMLEVMTRIDRIGNRSMRFQSAIYVQGADQPAATSTGVLVWFDFASQQSAPVPTPLRSAIIDYEPIPPTT